MEQTVGFEPQRGEIVFVSSLRDLEYVYVKLDYKNISPSGLVILKCPF